MYVICCGEGGLSPHYFFHNLTRWEANAFMEGVYRRYRAAWEQARLVADVNARCAGNKQGVRIDFPWEREQRLAETAPPTPEEMEELRAFAKKVEQKRKERLANGNNVVSEGAGVHRLS